LGCGWCKKHATIEGFADRGGEQEGSLTNNSR
jgi:hypothetical protein